MLRSHEEGAAPATDGPRGNTQRRINYIPDRAFSMRHWTPLAIVLAMQLSVIGWAAVMVR